MRKLHFDMISWKYDVEAFARWLNFYKMANYEDTKQRVYDRLIRLQEKSPHQRQCLEKRSPRMTRKIENVLCIIIFVLALWGGIAYAGKELDQRFAAEDRV